MTEELIKLLEEYQKHVDKEAETEFGAMDLRGFLAWLKERNNG